MADQYNISDVFISYSRRDKEFVRQLFARLKGDERNIWVDWEDIPPTANWWSEIEAGIEGANTFIFIISPDSVSSKICQDEIDHAIKLSKRFVPVLHRPIDDPELSKVMHPVINSHNWVFFRDEDDQDEAYANLTRALDIDLQHVRMHTRLLVRAREWDARGRESSFLLSGLEVLEAKAWLEASEKKKPPATDLHGEFILTSIVHQRVRQRNLIIGITVTLIITGLAILSFALFQNASSNLSLANVRGTDARGQAVTAAFNADAARTSAADALNAQGTADANANLAATNAADALNAQSTADFNARIAIQQAITAVAARQDAQQSANDAATSAADAIDARGTADANFLVAATSAADAIEARGTADANFFAAATSAADAIEARGTADTLRLTAEGDAFLRGETAVAALATSESRGTEIAIAQSDALQSAQNARAIALASQSEQAAQSGNSQQSILLALAAVKESAISWEAERALAQSLVTQFVPIALAEAEGEGGLLPIAFSPSDNTVALAYTLPLVRLWSIETQTILATYDDHGAWVVDIAFSSDGRLLATAGRDRKVVIRDVTLPADDSGIVAELQGIHTDAIQQVIWSPDGTRIMTVGEDARVIVWDIATSARLYQLQAHNGALIEDAVWSADGAWLATGDENGMVIVWQADDGSERYRYQDHTEAVTSLAWTANGRYLATGSKDDFVFIYNTDGTLERKLEAHISDIVVLSWSPNDRYLASASFDGTTRVWLMREEDPIAILIGHTRPIMSMAWAPDNNRIATVASDQTLRIWNIRKANRSVIVTMPDNTTAGVGWAPDARTVVTTSDELNLPQLWSFWTNTSDLVAHANDCCVERVLTYEEAILADLDPAPSAPIPDTIVSCDNVRESRLYPGVWGAVDRSTSDSRLLNVRIRPGTSSARIDQISPGQFFRVINGPECDGSYAWFEILYGLEAESGWVAEGEVEAYFAEPVYFGLDTASQTDN